MVQDLSRSRRGLDRRFVALLAIQIGPHILVTSGDSEHPRAIDEWRLMSYVLSMTTGQLSNPIAIVILVISDDGLLHVVMILVLQEGVGIATPRSDHRYGFLSDSLGFAPMSTFLERQLRPLSGRKILPSLFLILIETSYKYHVAIKMAKLSQACSAVLRIDDTRIILPDDIHASS